MTPLDLLLSEAFARFQRFTPAEQAQHRFDQRVAQVLGDARLAEPGVTREEVRAWLREMEGK